MPTPDLSGYVDLALYDRDVADLVDRAILDAAVKLPGWVPREANTEVVLIEALAQEVAELVYAINRVPAAVTMALLGLFDVTRGDGRPPTTTVRVDVIDDAGYTVPAGTLVRLDTGAEPLVFATDADLVIPAGVTFGVTAATGTTNTDAANGIPAGTPVDLISSVFAAESAELGAAVADGALPEDDLAWLDRGVNRLRRLTSTLVLPEHFTAAALEEADVDRAATIDLYDPGQAGNPGDHPGHVTVAVLGAAASFLSTARKAEVELTLEALAVANLDAHVIDPTITVVDVALTVRRTRGYDAAEVAAGVEAAIRDYLSAATWEWGGLVRLFELVAIADGVDGVDFVEQVAAPAGDVALAGIAPLAAAGTVTVAVTSA